MTTSSLTIFSGFLLVVVLVLAGFLIRRKDEEQ
jgi:hypothetical protein